MAVSLPFLFFVSTMAAALSVSFVAIQLRGECRNLGLGAGFFRSPSTDLKLLKSLILTASKVMFNCTIQLTYFSTLNRWGKPVRLQWLQTTKKQRLAVRDLAPLTL